VALAGSAETFSYAGVPAGSYTFSVRARNATGVSAPSNAVTLTFPGPCAAAEAPTSLTASVSGSLVTLAWVAPAGGGTPASYRIEAGSAPGQANLASIDTGGTATTFSAPAPPGTYHVRVRAANACGASAPTADVVVTVP
jgi:predicted phage tail protein